MEDKESLESNAVLCQLADSFQYKVNDLLANGIVTAGVIIGCILFTVDHLLRVKQATIRTRAYFICIIF